MFGPRGTFNHPQDSRQRILVGGHAEIISWSIPPEIKNKPAAGDLGEDAIEGSWHSLIHPGSIKSLNEPDINLHE